MGLSEPRKRLKLSHDPRNTQWTSDTTSFGHRYMLSSGWTPGTALGASSTGPTPASESSAAKVRIAVKDDTLGLGASLKSRNVEHQRTGLDAFQGLLGRLNAKDANEVVAVERKIEDKKLAMFALGRWGGMTFVPGGKLVQDDPTEKKQPEVEEADTQTDAEMVVNTESSETSRKDRKKKSTKSKKSREAEESKSSSDDEEEKVEEGNAHTVGEETPEQRAVRKAEKRRRKEERRIRREAKRLKKLQRLKDGTGQSGTDTAGSEMQISDFTTSVATSRTGTGTSTPVLTGEKTEQKLNVTAITQQRLSNGRHLLRGRNIQAKRLAFSDAKGLDQIFMRQAQEMKV